MPGTQVWSETAQTRSCVSPSVQLLSVWGRHVPTAPGGAQVISSIVLSKVSAPGSHSRALTVLPFHPIPSQLLGWPLHKHPWSCLSLSAAGQGECSSQRRSLICFRGAVGRAAPQQLPCLSCTHSCAHIPPLEGQLPDCLYCTSLCCSSSLAWEMHTSILRRKLIKKRKRKKQ